MKPRMLKQAQNDAAVLSKVESPIAGVLNKVVVRSSMA
jgi:hypothetical protein